jgi:hypothetical protein
VSKAGQGFLTFAFNTEDVNYLELAYLQALNIKATQQENQYAVIVDTATQELVEDRHRRVFDHVIVFDKINPTVGLHAFDAEPYAFDLTPFKETIKLESDLLFTRSIDHWWTTFRLRDICLSTGAQDFTSGVSAVKKYRELFEANNLPDVYNGLMYFRYSRQAFEFFSAAKTLSSCWQDVQSLLKKCFENRPSTDVLYGLTALMVGEECCTMPSVDFLNFVHMKSGFNGWSDTQSWLDTVMNERDGDIIRINNLNQLSPVHYYDKSYATQELIKYYEQRVLG